MTTKTDYNSTVLYLLQYNANQILTSSEPTLSVSDSALILDNGLQTLHRTVCWDYYYYYYYYYYNINVPYKKSPRARASSRVQQNQNYKIQYE